jgi:glycosyltransferase involved in cell wall biosynthesis
MPESSVAVIMPAYNCERYIRQSVESILGQTFGDFEFIIVNDGSTDGTADALAEFRDPRLRIVSQSNRGIAGALNAALVVALGRPRPAPLIARMDADDIAESERLARQVGYMRGHKEGKRCVLLGTGVKTICPAGLPFYEKEVPVGHETIARALWSGNSQAVIHPTIMMRTEVVERIGGYSPRYSNAEDLDIYLRLIEHGEVANIPEPLLSYRQHPESTNNTKYHMLVRLLQEIIAEHDPRCPFSDLDRRRLAGWERMPPIDEYRRWGWNALSHGRVDVARTYAARAMRLAPLSPDSWRLLCCTIRGR